MPVNFPHSTAISYPPLACWLQETQGPRELQLAATLDACTARAPCKSGACVKCGQRFQTAAELAMNRFLGPLTQEIRGRKSLLTTVSATGIVMPCKLNREHFLMVRTEILAALRAAGVRAAIGNVEASFQEDCNGDVPEHWAVHAHAIVTDWLSDEQKARLRSAIPSHDWVERPVHSGPLDDRPNAKLYVFKPERVRKMASERPADGTSAPPPRRRCLRKSQAMELALVEHDLGFFRKIFSHGINDAALRQQLKQAMIPKVPVRRIKGPC